MLQFLLAAAKAGDYMQTKHINCHLSATDIYLLVIILSKKTVQDGKF